MQNQPNNANTAIALVVGIALAILLVGLTLASVAQMGPIAFAVFIVPLVAGVFYFTRGRHPIFAGVDTAVVFFTLTFVYVMVLAGGIGLGFFSLR